jgi:endonuclease III
MWENTYNDIQQLIDDVADAIDADEPSIKEFMHSKNNTERDHVKYVIEACHELIELFEQLEQYDED